MKPVCRHRDAIVGQRGRSAVCQPDLRCGALGFRVHLELQRHPLGVGQALYGNARAGEAHGMVQTWMPGHATGEGAQLLRIKPQRPHPAIGFLLKGHRAMDKGGRPLRVRPGGIDRLPEALGHRDPIDGNLSFLRRPTGSLEHQPGASLHLAIVA